MTHPRTAGFDAARPLIKPELGMDSFTPGLIHVLDAVLDAAGVERLPVSGPGLGGAAAPVAIPPVIPAMDGVGVAIDPDIAMVDVDLLAIACPTVPKATLAPWVEPIRGACIHYHMDNIRRVAAFIAQTAVESQCFTKIVENLNYSAERLHAVWPHRFPSIVAAAPYAHNPEKLANFTYANRMGNGPPESGDGWRGRGGGLIMVTGMASWKALAAFLGKSLEETFTYVRETKEGAVMAAAWFWERNDLNRAADTPGVADETQLINGGQNGANERAGKFNAVVAEMLRRAA